MRIDENDYFEEYYEEEFDLKAEKQGSALLLIMGIIFLSVAILIVMLFISISKEGSNISKNWIEVKAKLVEYGDYYDEDGALYYGIYEGEFEGKTMTFEGNESGTSQWMIAKTKSFYLDPDDTSHYEEPLSNVVLIIFGLVFGLGFGGIGIFLISAWHNAHKQLKEYL